VNEDFVKKRQKNVVFLRKKLRNAEAQFCQMVEMQRHGF
jgi:hypothetical protein